MLCDTTTAEAATAYFAFERHGSSTPLFGRGTQPDADGYQRMLNHWAPLNHFTVRPVTPVEASSIRAGRFSTFSISNEMTKHRRQAGHRDPRD